MTTNFVGTAVRRMGLGEKADKEFGLGHQVQCLIDIQVEIVPSSCVIGTWNSGEKPELEM